ncbi:MAG: TonB family protein [Bacteroidales bacterium]|nr:TonB family protein [Bacteroidales bacterium]
MYYDSSMDTVQVIDYSRVWNFLQENANIKLENSNLMELKTKYKRGILPDGSFSNSEIPPTFNRNSGYDNFNDFVKKNMVYPPYANCKGIYGEVDIQFVVDREGKIRKPEIFNSWYSDLNIEAIRVLSESPPWKPGLQDNIPLNIQCNWRFNFSQDGLFSAQPIEFSDNVNAFSDDSVLDKRDEEIFYLVEDMPRFDNGDPSVTFTKYIENNLHYPENAIKNSKSGRVILQFIVTGTGEVKDVVLVSPLDPEMDAEAKRVVMSSPQWTPGRQRGKPATVLFTFPVDFILDKENDGK